MTPNRLGLDPATTKAVWVHWVEASDLATAGTFLAALFRLAGAFNCPECNGAVNLARYRGVLQIVAETPNCTSVSDRCPTCAAQLHFDATPQPRRAALHWPAVAIGGPLVVPDTLPADLVAAARMLVLGQ